MLISKGFRIEITSWENDGDAYNTKIIQTEDEPFVKLLAELSKVLKSNSNHKGCIGNMYEPDETKINKIKNTVKPILLKNSPAVLKFFGECNLDESVLDIFSELHHEMCGGSENFYTRVVESFMVSYSPETIEIEDVTQKFI